MDTTAELHIGASTQPASPGTALFYPYRYAVESGLHARTGAECASA